MSIGGRDEEVSADRKHSLVTAPGVGLTPRMRSPTAMPIADPAEEAGPGMPRRAPSDLAER